MPYADDLPLRRPQQSFGSRAPPGAELAPLLHNPLVVAEVPQIVGQMKRYGP